MMNRPALLTKLPKNDPSTLREQRILPDRIQIAGENSHPNSANVSLGKVPNQFLIKRQAKGGT
ncbi:MAG: hypothetical protein ABI618_08350 [Nitrospirota bacterium]